MYLGKEMHVLHSSTKLASYQLEAKITTLNTRQGEKQIKQILRSHLQGGPGKKNTKTMSKHGIEYAARC